MLQKNSDLEKSSLMKHFPKHWQTSQNNNYRLEGLIIDRVISNVFKAGMVITVIDGEEFTDCRRSKDRAEIEAECFATDETIFRLHDAEDHSKYRGFVHFIHGNGGHVIHDYSANVRLDRIIDPVLDFAATKGW